MKIKNARSVNSKKKIQTSTQTWYQNGTQSTSASASEIASNASILARITIPTGTTVIKLNAPPSPPPRKTGALVLKRYSPLNR